jgi:hypothetical protein
MMCISTTIKYYYGLICKNNPKWGLVLLASGPDGHLIRCTGHFPVIQQNMNETVILLVP